MTDLTGGGALSNGSNALVGGDAKANLSRDVTDDGCDEEVETLFSGLTGEGGREWEWAFGLPLRVCGAEVSTTRESRHSELLLPGLSKPYRCVLFFAG